MSKVCVDCALVIVDERYQGPARYMCRKGMKMYPNMAPRHHTARAMRDGACGKDARYYQDTPAKASPSLEGGKVNERATAGGLHK